MDFLGVGQIGRKVTGMCLFLILLQLLEILGVGRWIEILDNVGAGEASISDVVDDVEFCFRIFDRLRV